MKRKCKDHINTKEMMTKLGLNKRNSFLDSVIYWFLRPYRNSYKNKLKALLEGLECQNLDKLVSEGKTGDYRRLGEAYIKAVREKVDQAKTDR